MSTKKGLLLTVVMGFVLFFISCGKNSKSSETQRVEQNSICKGLECFSSIDWHINLVGQSFPIKTKFEINGLTVINECLSKQKNYINREGNPESITLLDYVVPTSNFVKIRIIDQGADCLDSKVFLENEEVHFDVVKDMQKSRIQINL